ncbi:hypothetical protein OKW37_003148 [Paraburkholderia sp. MM5482-R2]|uniref:hypothetical protein n=2 Tax=unclassified Paraburkholderia TaxID=2615204 RepID=UPI003D245EA5
MSNLPKRIRAIFDNNPKLYELIPRPVLISENSLGSALNVALSHGARGGRQDDVFYRIVFKKDSSRELMAINSGELKGLLTTACVEKGRISAVAGLEPVEVDSAHALMPALLGLSVFGAMQANLSYIANLCVDIRNHQIAEEQSRFERISAVIVECFEAIPDLALDSAMKHAYLSRIAKNNDDCLQMFFLQKENFRRLLRSQPEPFSASYNGWLSDGPSGPCYFPGRFFESDVLNHPVFAVFERLAAGKICEIIISGNFSEENISRYKKAVVRAQSQLMELLEHRLDAFERFTNDAETELENSAQLPDYERENRLSHLASHISFVARIRSRLDQLLDIKCSSFDILARLANQDEIDAFLINGALVRSGLQDAGEVVASTPASC